MTTLKDHADKLDKIEDALNEDGWLYEGYAITALRSIAADLRARDEAEKRMCDMATGRDTGDTQTGPEYEPYTIGGHITGYTLKNSPIVSSDQPAPAVGETPRVDAAEFHSSDAKQILCVRAEFARQLERELNAALAAQERKE